MYEGYSNAVYEALPGVTVVVDRFHVAKNYRGCADKARKQEMKLLKKTLSDEEYAELKGVMWIFRKSCLALSPEQEATLLLLFSYAPILKHVYFFRELLTGIFNRPLTKAQAVIELNAWITQVQALKLSCFDSFVGTLQKWMNEVSNYFIQRASSGFVEGLNNKIKVIKRRVMAYMTWVGCSSIFGLILKVGVCLVMANTICSGSPHEIGKSQNYLKITTCIDL